MKVSLAWLRWSASSRRSSHAERRAHRFLSSACPECWCARTKAVRSMRSAEGAPQLTHVVGRGLRALTRHRRRARRAPSDRSTRRVVGQASADPSRALAGDRGQPAIDVIDDACVTPFRRAGPKGRSASPRTLPRVHRSGHLLRPARRHRRLRRARGTPHCPRFPRRIARG